MARHEPIADQLEKLGWKPGSLLPVMNNERWGAIIGAILKFKQEHEGRSPSNPLIASATGLSPGQVQHLLAEMQREGIVHDKEGWPRNLIVNASAIQQKAAEPAAPAAPTEEEEMASIEVPQPMKERNGRKRRESFMVNAKRFAQVLVDYQDTHGHAPLIKDIAAELGYETSKPVGVSRVVKEMVQRGWLFHKPGHHADFMLTGLGRAVLFGEPIHAELHTDIPVRPQPVKAQYPEPPPRMEVRRAPSVPFRPSPEQPPARTPRDPATMPSRHWLNEVSPPVMAVRKPEPRYVPVEDPQPTAAPRVEHYVATVEPRMTTQPDLSTVDSVDLLLELQGRGFRVTR